MAPFLSRQMSVFRKRALRKSGTSGLCCCCLFSLSLPARRCSGWGLSDGSCCCFLLCRFVLVTSKSVAGAVVPMASLTTRSVCPLCYIAAWCLCLPPLSGMFVQSLSEVRRFLAEHPFSLSVRTAPVVSNEFRAGFDQGNIGSFQYLFSYRAKVGPQFFCHVPAALAALLSGDFLQHFRAWLPWSVLPVAARTDTLACGVFRHIIRSARQHLECCSVPSTL